MAKQNALILLPLPTLLYIVLYSLYTANVFLNHLHNLPVSEADPYFCRNSSASGKSRTLAESVIQSRHSLRKCQADRR